MDFSTAVFNDGIVAYYAHGRNADRANGRVRANDVIGHVSDSGNARNTSFHLHFAAGLIRPSGGGTIPSWEWLAGL